MISEIGGEGGEGEGWADMLRQDIIVTGDEHRPARSGDLVDGQGGQRERGESTRARFV